MNDFICVKVLQSADNLSTVALNFELCESFSSFEEIIESLSGKMLSKESYEEELLDLYRVPEECRHFLDLQRHVQIRQYGHVSRICGS